LDSKSILIFIWSLYGAFDDNVTGITYPEKHWRRTCGMLLKNQELLLYVIDKIAEDKSDF